MAGENVYRWLLLAIVAVGFGMSVYFRRKADRAGGSVCRREESLAFLTLQGAFGLGAIGGLLVYLLNPAWMRWAQLDLPTWLRLTGGPLGLVGLALFYWVFQFLGGNVTPTARTRAQHTLVTSGPYRWVRHPMYSSGAVLFGAYSLLTANWFVAAMCAIALVLLVVRVPAEEANLIDRFGGAYRDYMRRTGRFLPRPRQKGS